MSIINFNTWFTTHLPISLVNIYSSVIYSIFYSITHPNSEALRAYLIYRDHHLHNPSSHPLLSNEVSAYLKAKTVYFEENGWLNNVSIRHVDILKRMAAVHYAQVICLVRSLNYLNYYLNYFKLLTISFYPHYRMDRKRSSLLYVCMHIHACIRIKGTCRVQTDLMSLGYTHHRW